MKIGEAQKTYSNQLNGLYQKRSQLLKIREESEKNGDIDTFNAASAEFAEIDKQYEAASKFMDGFSTYRNGLINAESSKRQGTAMEEAAEEYAKILEIARRISRGDIVPPEDEERLMKFDGNMYMMAKNMAAMHNDEEREEHDSLWDEDDKPTEYDMSVDETVDNMNCAVTMPADLSAGIAESLG